VLAMTIVQTNGRLCPTLSEKPKKQVILRSDEISRYIEVHRGTKVTYFWNIQISPAPTTTYYASRWTPKHLNPSHKKYNQETTV